ncbi:MAG: glycerophosphoryl diester phosphodiesterase membrane domain-containing protein [Elainellaceae cyanobacterium]
MDIKHVVKETFRHCRSAKGLAIILLPTAFTALVPVTELSTIMRLLYYSIAVALSVFLWGAALFYAYAVAQGRSVTLSNAFGHGAAQFFPLLGTSLLTYLLVFSGLLLLILPGLYLSIRLAFAACAATVDDDSPIEALSHSWTLTSRRFWPVLGAFGVLILIVFAMAIAIGMVTAIAAIMVPAASGVLIALANGSAGLLVSVFAVLYTVVLYQQLSKRSVERPVRRPVG